MIRFLQSSGKTKKIVLGGMLLLICGAMVITLVPGGVLGDTFGFGAPQQGVLARVGSQDVTLLEVDQAARRYAQQRFGGRLPSEFLPRIRQGVAEQLIVQKALLTEAERMGYKATDAELQQLLQKSPELFPNGQYAGEPAYE